MESLKANIKTVKSYVQRWFSDMPAWLVDVVLFAVVGFFAGFILKKFGRLALMVVVVLAVFLLALDYLSLISLQSIISSVPSTPLQSLVRSGVTWMQHHFLGLLVALAAFIFGHRLG